MCFLKRKRALESPKFLKVEIHFFRALSSNVVAIAPSNVVPIYVGYGIGFAYPSENNSKVFDLVE